ncbi:hypothetical protein GCM10010965_14490 [Caldalkalibacillus thermarum]|uniref:hypothetical protein n=1 Tax=Caldalkalibacillus thermarum TaxID=296745 RepID=UPI00166E3BD6|nr:hypothetical protein [Caldalkalibacillus thermarum]GGK22685.1 hypothetical protein GCM10010965_14490 [Caldalkalibacillus thermarum]
MMSFTLIELCEGQTPTGRPFVKIVVRNDAGEKFFVLACTPEKIAEAMSIPVDRPFGMTWQEQNGFRFLDSVKNGDQS